MTTLDVEIRDLLTDVPDLRPDSNVVEREATWGEVVPGMAMKDPNGEFWLVIDEREGWLRLRGKGARYRSIPRRPPELPVTVAELITHQHAEAVELLRDWMGAVVLTELDRRTLPERSMRWKLEVLPTTGKAAKQRIKDHIDWCHNGYVGDGFAKTTAKKLWQTHEEMHQLGDIALPHHHAPGGST